MLPPTARFYELNCSFPIVQEIAVLIRRELVIFFIIHDTVAYRYGRVISTRYRFDADGIPVVSREVRIIEFHGSP